MGETDELVTMTQAAALLGLDRASIYRIFPPERRVYVAGRPFLRRADLDTYRPNPDRPGRPRTPKDEA